MHGSLILLLFGLLEAATIQPVQPVAPPIYGWAKEEAPARKFQVVTVATGSFERLATAETAWNIGAANVAAWTKESDNA